LVTGSLFDYQHHSVEESYVMKLLIIWSILIIVSLLIRFLAESKEPYMFGLIWDCGAGLAAFLITNHQV